MVSIIDFSTIYAKLYCLITEELCYILDSQDVYGPDFPGETFRVLKEKEIKQLGVIELGGWCWRLGVG